MSIIVCDEFRCFEKITINLNIFIHFCWVECTTHTHISLHTRDLSHRPTPEIVVSIDEIAVHVSYMEVIDEGRKLLH